MRLILPILHYDEESATLEALDIPTSDRDGIFRDVIFYNIDAVGDDAVNGVPTKGAIIYCGGLEFITHLSKEEVDQMISNSNQKL